MEVKEGVIANIIFASGDGDFTVAELKEGEEGISDFLSESEQRTTVVGEMGSVSEGDYVQVKGHWTTHEQYGRQLEVDQCFSEDPTSPEGMRMYLQEFQQVGASRAADLVEAYGEDLLDLLDEQKHEKISEVIGDDNAAALLRDWGERRHEHREMIMALQEYGLTNHQAETIVEAYGDSSLQILQSNPWQLASDVDGIGFSTADEIALEYMNFDEDDPKRVREGVVYVLQQSYYDDGNAYEPREELENRVFAELEIDWEDLQGAISWLEEAGRIAVEEGRIYLAKSWREEESIARSLSWMLSADAHFNKRVRFFCEPRDPEQHEPMDFYSQVHSASPKDYDSPDGFKIDESEIVEREPLSFKENSLGTMGTPIYDTLTDKQREAVERALSGDPTIVTGGPGTGKTYTIEAIADTVQNLGGTLSICAPTGRAAKRITEVTGHGATTIHRLLNWMPERGPQIDQVLADVVIVDEISMIDQNVAYHLFSRIPDHACLVLVGDDDQLPSVGPGRVLTDMIDSERIPVVRLDEVHRQEEGSKIIENAHRVNAGQSEMKSGEDFYWIEATSDDRIREVVIECIDRGGPDGAFEPEEDIQVMSPQYNGEVGVQSMNETLQEYHHPGQTRTVCDLYRGDRVLQMENNYDLDVYNGEIGRVADFGHAEVGGDVLETATVEFADRTIKYRGKDEIYELAPAWCITVHKSQGSEFPCVILPISSAHTWMWSRTLLYTALTRATECVIMVGDSDVRRSAVRSQRSKRRNTTLSARIRKRYDENQEKRG